MSLITAMAERNGAQGKDALARGESPRLRSVACKCVEDESTGRVECCLTSEREGERASECECERKGGCEWTDVFVARSRNMDWYCYW